MSTKNPLGLLAVEDFKTLKSGDLSLDCMNYLLDFILPQKFLNLSLFADQMLNGIDCFGFSINDKTCFIPHFDSLLQEWVLYVINSTKSSFCYVASNMEERNLPEEKLKWFGKFIDAYNSSNRRNKLKNVAYWRAVTVTENEFGTRSDSGVCVVNYVYKMTNTVEAEVFDANIFRNTLLSEVLQYSEDMTEVCLKCGQSDDTSFTESILWTMCVSCDRWIHDLCFDLTNENCPLCTSKMLP